MKPDEMSESSKCSCVLIPFFFPDPFFNGYVMRNKRNLACFLSLTTVVTQILHLNTKKNEEVPAVLWTSVRLQVRSLLRDSRSRGPLFKVGFGRKIAVEDLGPYRSTMPVQARDVGPRVFQDKAKRQLLLSSHVRFE